MSDLFYRIANIVPRMHGWCSVEKAQALASMVVTLRPNTIVEIGVFGGRSLIPMAMAAKEVGHGLVIGIDPWSSQASAIGQRGENLEWWGKKINHQMVYDSFVSFIAETGTRDFIRIEQKRSDEMEPPDSIELYHCDGNHSEQAIRDVERFAPKVGVGKLVVMDDLDWDGGAVRVAEQRLLAMGFAQLYRLGTGAVYQRVCA